MIKKFFFLAFICALVGCQKDTDQLNETGQLNSKELISSNKLAAASGYGDLPQEVKDIIANGGVGHIADCEISNDKQALNGGSLNGGSSTLGSYAYPYTPSVSPIRLYNSSLPCQPNTPYFIFSYVDSEGDDKSSDNYSVTFRLVLNPSYYNPVKVVDVNWELNGQNDAVPVQSFTIDDLHIGQSNAVSCEVFSTENNVTVYSQEMTFDFEILLSPGVGPIIEFGSGYTYACTNTGIFPIIAP